MAEAIYDHDINEAHELLDKLVPGTSGYDQSIPERLIILSERLEALEEIRQRVADGWQPLPADSAIGSSPAWVHAHDWSEPEITPDVAAVLWPDPLEGT